MKNPSDLYNAIVNTLKNTLVDGIRVESYPSFFNLEFSGVMVVVEFEQSTAATRGHDGRYCHQYDITLHAVISRESPTAELDAIDLSAALARTIDSNLWGLPPRQIEPPENIRSGPSLFKNGPTGFEGWGVSFTQKIYLGKSLYDDQIVNEMLFATDNFNTVSSYERFDH